MWWRAALVVGVVAVLASIAALFRPSGQSPAVATDGPVFSASITGDAVAGPCSTKTGDPKANQPLKCGVEVGSAFTLAVSVNKIGLPDLDLDTAAGYRGFLVRVDFPTKLTLKDQPGTA